MGMLQTKVLGLKTWYINFAVVCDETVSVVSELYKMVSDLISGYEPRNIYERIISSRSF